MQGRIDGGALGESAGVGVAAVDVGNGALAAEQGAGHAFLANLGDGRFDELLHAGVALEIGFDVFFRLAAGDAQLRGEAEAADAVHDAEVHGFGVAAQLRGHGHGADAEDFGRGAGVDVLAFGEGVEQDRVARHVRQQAQLDLRIVGDDELPAFARDKRGADLPSELGADGDILQIRIGRREATGGGSGLIEARVEAAAVGADKLRKRVDISALQLGELAVFQNLADDLVVCRELVQNIGRGGNGFAFAVADGRGQLQLLKQHFP